MKVVPNPPPEWDALADSFPPRVGWFRCDRETTTEILFNSVLLSRDPSCFPLRARIRVYEGGALTASVHTPGIGCMESPRFNLNALFGGREVREGYLEISVVPVADARDRESFLGEMWCSVFSADGRMAVNYPPLHSRGVNVGLLDTNCAYYPGIIADDSFTMETVLLNQYGFASHADVSIYDAAGERQIDRRVALPGKSAVRVRLEDVFPEPADFFGGAPGLLIVKFPYKMHAFIQTVHKGRATICGMDHLGFLTVAPSPETAWAADRALVQRNRVEDRIVCFCKSVPESRLKEFQAAGCGLSGVMKTCGAGTVCRGCVADLQTLFHEEALGVT